MVDDPRSRSNTEELDGGVESLLGRCIEAAESGDAGSLRALLGERPDVAPRLRRALAALARAGLVVGASDDAPGLDTLPDRIGRYRPLGELGRGGQGIVYLAEDPSLGRVVAVKVMNVTGPLSEPLVQRFRREAILASRLRHPGICAVHDADVTEGASWIAMEYVDGETLAERIARRPLQGGAPAEGARRDAGSAGEGAREEILERVRLVEQAARAAHHAHEAGIVHRDIKPGNIMITPDGRAVLMDFGLARGDETDATLTRSGDVFGTPAYMAPEQIEGQAADRRTDVWALGVTLHEAVTGERPFSAPTRAGLFRAIIERPPDVSRRAVRAVPRDLTVVIERSLAKAPDERYATALALAEELDRIREGRPVLARPLPPAIRAWRWMRRNPLVATSVAAAILALAGGLLAALLLLAERTEALHQYARMSDASLARRLREEEPTLWPAWPERAPVMDAWLGRARDLLSRREDHERALSELRQRASAVPPDGADSQRADTWRFDDDEQAWRHDVLTALLADLDPLVLDMADVERRRAFAAGPVTSALDQHQEAWRRLADALREDPRFAGVVLEAQVGLVPLGRDRASRLPEFWVLGSGEAPGWDGDLDAGTVRMDQRSAVVLVLLPGGRFFMGSHSDDSEGPNYDGAGAPPYAAPVHEVELDPFFVAKFELTQGQWVHLFGRNPSTIVEGSRVSGHEVTGLSPVESIDWEEARLAARRLGCALPTEAQWEYAARGGRGTPWWPGTDVASLAGTANLSDAAAGRETAWGYEPSLDDGHVAHAPVGSFRASPFGLHDVVGNVWEWVTDAEVAYEVPARKGDGARFAEGVDRGRIQRGGSFCTPPAAARSANRTALPPNHRDKDVGVRLVRPFPK